MSTFPVESAAIIEEILTGVNRTIFPSGFNMESVTVLLILYM